jgi:hypothetical protein
MNNVQHVINKLSPRLLQFIGSHKLQLKRLLLILLIFAIATLSATTNIAHWTYTSDDVAQQAITHDLTQSGPHNILLENDTYVSKLPIYLVFNFLMKPGKTELVLESLVFNSLMVGLLLWWWSLFSYHKEATFLSIVWLLAAGVFWMSLTINPNTRNVDLGIMLVYAAYAIKLMSSPPNKYSMKLFTVPAFGIIGGCLTYDDPYFLFFIIFPLFAALCTQSYARKTFKALAIFPVVLVICLSVYFGLGEIFKHFDILISSKNELNSIAATITRPHDLPKRALQVVNAYLSLLGASPAYVSPNGFEWLRITVNAIVVLLGLSGLWIIIRNRSSDVLHLYIPLTFVAVFACLIITGVSIAESARYLIVLLPLTALLVGITLEQWHRQHPAYYKWIASVVVVAIVCNIIQGVAHLYQKEVPQSQNHISHQLASVMQKDNVSAVYATYWLSNITYYLSDYRANVLPAICSKGRLFQDPTLLDEIRFNKRYKNIGILVSPNFIVPNENSLVNVNNKPLNSSCTLEAMRKQFGAPQKTISVSSSIELLVYQSVK